MTSGPRPAATAATPEVNGAVVPPAAPAPSYAREDLLAAVAALAPRLRAASDEIERGRSLTEPLVEALVDAGLYRLFLPRSLGGGETNAPLRRVRGPHASDARMRRS